MSKLVDLYNAKQKEIGADLIGAGKRDETPYSLGTTSAGSKNIDEPAIVKLESKRGKRYGLGELGTGSKFLTAGYNPQKKYSDTVKK
jgi:hypothetical protein